MLMQREHATLLVVDVQEKLAPAVHDADGLLARLQWLVGAVRDTGVPVVFSEQYPKGLGHTVPALRDVAPNARTVEKQHFSCVAGDCLPDSLMQRDQVIVCGMETHVCVLQTVIDLLDEDKEVYVVSDAVSSRREADHQAGLARMRDAGAQLVTREMVLFELLHQAGTDEFKAASKRYLVGEQPA